MNPGPQHLADLLRDHVIRVGLVDFELLGTNPAEALLADPSIRTTWVEPESLSADCGIAASYDPATTPATISVARSESTGRQAFSVLHEYGHHLRNQVDDVLLALLRAGRRRAHFEERMCDAFAATTLIPPSSRENTFRDGVTAAAVVHLLNNTEASRQAVLVAAAQRMTAPGYVAVMNRLGQVLFAARSGDVYPIRPGAQQEGPLKRAATGTPVRTTAVLHYGTGAHTNELAIDAAAAGSDVIIVAIDGPAPWQPFSRGRAVWAEPVRMWCDECATSTETFAPPCGTCNEHRCEACHRCGCVAEPATTERVCCRCYLNLPVAAFQGNDTWCDDCA